MASTRQATRLQSKWKNNAWKWDVINKSADSNELEGLCADRCVPGGGGSMALAKHVLEHGPGNQRMRLLGGEPYLSLKWWDKSAGMRVSCSVRVGIWSWTSQLPGSDLVD